MARFVKGVDRSQALLLPDRLEDYIHQDDPVRLVDAFVKALDLGVLGFEAASCSAGGRPAYITRPRCSRSTSMATSTACSPAVGWSARRSATRADLAVRTTSARFQDDRRFPQEQRRRDCGGAQPLHRFVARNEAVLACGGRNRWQ